MKKLGKNTNEMTHKQKKAKSAQVMAAREKRIRSSVEAHEN